MTGNQFGKLQEQKILINFIIKKRLTIFALANLIGLPTETVRRKIEILKKKKLISNNGKLGLMPTEKIEELMKPFALNEVDELSNFLRSLDKHGSLDALLEKQYKTQDSQKLDSFGLNNYPFWVFNYLI